jgi:hypothetical protein
MDDVLRLSGSARLILETHRAIRADASINAGGMGTSTCDENEQPSDKNGRAAHTRILAPLH